MWRVAMPAWGERCVGLALNVAIPSVLAAARHAGVPLRLSVYTDRPSAFAGVSGEIYPVDAEAGFNALAPIHRAILRDAQDGERVGFFNADHVVSRETLLACERAFASGYKAVYCASPRTLGGVPPESGASAAEVMDFALRHPHPITIESTWPEGNTVWPSVTYFSEGANVVMHAFHMHPCAVVKGPGLRFAGTVDGEMIRCFERHEIHVVTAPDEMALAEISPLNRRLGAYNIPNRVEEIAEWAAGHTSPEHWWLFRHRVVLRGDGRAVPREPVDEILRLIGA